LGGSEINPRAILLDIEGTTTPIHFVHEVLFPYARLHGREFILNHLEDEEIQAALRELQIESARDRDDKRPVIRNDSATAVEDTIAYYAWLIDRDRKSTPLKTIQGRIWQDGYARGELRGIVYADVPSAFQRWREEGRRIAIYSSGSALAQGLLFRNSSAGDLTPFISAYFDTRAGHKREMESYIRIAASLNLPAREVLFVSDTVEELDAARAAGMSTVLRARQGVSASEAGQGHAAIRSFEALATE
jgi:enolase-phosphatase E1